MSMFRKPKKIQRRIFSANDDEDENPHRVQERSIDVEKKIDTNEDADFVLNENESNDKKTNSKINKDKNAPKALLSFADDEEDTEVFQVRKSSHSKKMMRMLGKERRRRDRIGTKGPQMADTMKDSNENNLWGNGAQGSSKNESFQTVDLTTQLNKEQVSGQLSQNYKNTLNTELSDKEKSRTRKEIHTDDLVLVVKEVNMEPIVLNGRAALCAGRDDISDEDDADNMDSDKNYKAMHRFSKPEKIKEMLESGSIPDAAMIHAARKRRQKAREQGEFMPINEKDDYQRNTNVKCEDAEDDNSEDERIDMNAITGSKEQDERRQIFYAAEANNSADDSDQELHNWEAQQLRKGVTGAQLINAQPESVLSRFIIKSSAYTLEDEENKPVSTSSLLEQAYAKSTHDRSQEYFKGTHSKDKSPSSVPAHAPQEILDAIRARLNKLTELNKKHTNEIEEMSNNIKDLESEIIYCQKRAPEVAKKYRFHQELKFYLIDLIDCLNEKLPLIVDLEQRTLQIYAKRQNFLIERRRNDVRDQTKEVVGASNLRPDQCEERIKRAAEREGRRTRRRYEREKKELGLMHLDGTSTDEEVSDTIIEQYQQNLEKIEKEVNSVCDDVVEEFYKISRILHKFLLWRQTDPQTYRDTFMSMFIPKILGPLIRLEMVTWSPISDNNKEIEKMNWFSLCMLYGREKNETVDSLRFNSDAQLVPSIVEKLVLPKAIELISQSWDPLSTRQTLRLIGFVNRLARDYPLRENSKTFQQLFQVVLDQMKTTLENDVFIPIFPKQIQESKTCFFQRQFCSSLKLFRNFLSWQGIIEDKQLIDLTITLLLNRYMLLAMRVCSINDAVSKAQHIVNTLPSVWLQKDSEALKSLETFTDFLKQLLEKCDPDNPLYSQPREDLKQILQKLYSY